MDQLEAIGATIITHRDPGWRGGIVIARLYDDLDVDRLVLKRLHARKIFIAQRFTDYVGGFRISCQYFNNHADIDAMAAGYEGAHPGDRTRPRLQSPLSPLPQQSRARWRKFRLAGSLPVEKFSTGREPFEPSKKVQKGV
ncbi:MAG: hypothetical protein ACLRNQ_22190 [Flavonifractor plautii]